MGAFIRFDADFLQNIRAKVDLPLLIGKDVQLQRAGPVSFKGCCPFHAEKSPSFFVRSDTGFYRCYGCQSTGDAIEWMQRQHGMSFHEAALHLARVEGVALPAQPDLPEEARQHLRATARLRQALEEAGRIYRRGLDKSNEARRYLVEKRGLTEASIAQFELGVVASGVVALLRRHSRQTLVDAGLCIEGEDGKAIDRFRHRIMIPIRGAGGALMSFAGRIYLGSDRRESKYLNGPETPLFRKGEELFGLHQARRAIRRTGTAVVVEGYFDVMALHQMGEDRAVAPMGTAFTSAHAAALLRIADVVIFAFDGDAAGGRAAGAAARTVLEQLKDGQSAYFVRLPAGHDPDSFARLEGADAWRAVLAAAHPLSTLLVDAIVENVDLQVVELRAAAAQRAHEVLALVKSAPLYRHSLRLALEATIGIPLE